MARGLSTPHLFVWRSLGRADTHVAVTHTCIHAYTVKTDQKQMGSVAETGSPADGCLQRQWSRCNVGRKQDELHLSGWLTICIEKSDLHSLLLCFLPPCWAFCNPTLLFVFHLPFLAFAEMFDITTVGNLDLCLAFVNMRNHCCLSCRIWRWAPILHNYLLCNKSGFFPPPHWEVVFYFPQLMTREGNCGGHCWTTATQKVADKDSRNVCPDRD